MQEINIKTYGSGIEVGRSAILIKDRDRKILLDAGVKILPKSLGANSLGPEGIDPIAPELDAIVLSHAHLDHSGYIPAMYRAGYHGTTYLTSPTIDIVEILWRDHLKIEGPYHYSPQHLQEAKSKLKGFQYNKPFKIVDGIYVTFMDAGHILGSASILVDWEGVRILYTGDINNQPTPFHDGVQFIDPDEPVDILITETTNATRTVPSRKNVINELRKDIQSTLQNSGKVLIPSFALGRGQEMQMYLIWEMGDLLTKYRLYVDGMINKMNHVYEKHFKKEWVSQRILNYVKENKLKSPFQHDNILHLERGKVKGGTESFRQKTALSKDQCIILSTSGMIEGGPIHSYLRYVGSMKPNLLAIVGYQVEGTIGHAIRDGVRDFVINPPWNEPPYDLHLELKIKKYDFSGHISALGLEEYTRFADPQKIITVHGSIEAQKTFEHRIKTSGYTVEQLDEGEELKIVRE